MDAVDLDRILSSEEPLSPSSGFAAGVMDAVRTASEQPPPLPFPWARFLPGVAACVIWAIGGVAVMQGIANDDALAIIAGRLAAVAPELGSVAVVLALCLMPIYGPRLTPRD